MALRESCWINGEPYFTRKAIGEFLGYTLPKQAITKIIKRNPYILKFRTVVNLTTVEGGRTLTNLVRVEDGRSGVKLTPLENGKTVTRKLDVFHPIGMQCIFFESHQPKAIEYKIVVASLLWELAKGTLKPSKWSQKGDLVSAARQILSLPEGRKRRALIIDLSAREGYSLNNTYRRMYLATGERLKTKAGKPRQTRSEAGIHRTRPEYQQVIDYKRQYPNAMGANIKHTLSINVSASRINAWIREGKNIH
jgi:hypothetical protein